ncbi:immunity 52 family protein [Archangium lipolyticum]|uniref:immunity 52 family protein n=1 Tax=Archangium lipolyticum TaxID=2970465 RepID=UPI00214A1916|nr:immunity 52 family protein [Archangium lipolyticum]
MSEPYYAAAYWGRRRESAEQCAKRAETFFHLLSACHADYSRWYEQASSTKRALQLQFEPTSDTFVRFFKKKKYQAGDDGFSFGAWTGHPENQGGMVLLGCGADTEGVTNLAQLYFPSEPPGRDRLVTLPVVSGVMRAMVLAWEPEWAVATPRDFRDHLSETGLPGTFVGWLTYYSRQWGDVPPLPEPVQVGQVEDKGTLVILSPERVDGAVEKHVALGSRIQQFLDGSGLLRRVGERRC